MLEQFTWQQFLLAALILTLVWYLGVILIYYRNKANDLFSGKAWRKPPEKLKHEWDEELEPESAEKPEPEELMGKAVEPQGVSTVPTDGFRFTAKKAQADEHKKDEQLGLVPDVLEELKEVFRVLENEDGDKADFFPMIGLIKEKYPAITGSDNLEEINRYIRDHVPFFLTDEELEGLWD